MQLVISDREQLEKVLEPVFGLARGTANPATIKSAITPELIEALSTTIFSKLFDDPVRHADFHKELWKIALSKKRKKAVAAPRSHAKSTCISLVWPLICMCFRLEEFMVIISNTEDQAARFIKTITYAVKELPELQIFGIKPKPSKSNETELEVEYTDGKKFYIKGKGFNQEIRGLVWHNKRPGFIICDDMEDTETCDSDIQRPKARKRFLADVVPALSRNGKIMIVGTILHYDSLLMNYLDNKNWETACYEGCDENFENVLWPEHRDSQWFREEYEDYKKQGNIEEFNREYRNKPIVAGSEYFPIRNIIEWDYDPKTDSRDLYEIYMIIDPAVTSLNSADDTAMAIFGVDCEDEIFLFDLYADKIDSVDFEGLFFEWAGRWNPDHIIMEKGTIKRAIEPFLEREMARKNKWYTLEGVHAHADKKVRAKSMQARMKAQKIYVNKNIMQHIKDKMYNQLVNFPKTKHDDIVDVFSYFGIWQNMVAQGPTEEQVKEVAWEMESSLYEMEYGDYEVDPDTGY